MGKRQICLIIETRDVGRLSRRLPFHLRLLLRRGVYEEVSIRSNLIKTIVLVNSLSRSQSRLL